MALIAPDDCADYYTRTIRLFDFGDRVTDPGHGFNI